MLSMANMLFFENFSMFNIEARGGVCHCCLFVFSMFHHHKATETPPLLLYYIFLSLEIATLPTSTIHLSLKILPRKGNET